MRLLRLDGERGGVDAGSRVRLCSFLPALDLSIWTTRPRKFFRTGSVIFNTWRGGSWCGQLAFSPGFTPILNHDSGGLPL